VDQMIFLSSGKAKLIACPEDHKKRARRRQK